MVEIHDVWGILTSTIRTGCVFTFIYESSVEESLLFRVLLSLLWVIKAPRFFPVHPLH